MCVADYRIARLVRAVPMRELVSGGGATFDIPANKQRVGITFFSKSIFGASLFLQLQEDGIFRSFLHLDLSDDMFHFTVQLNGDLPARAWRLENTDVGDSDCTWIEYYLPEQALAMTPEEIFR